MSFGSRKILGTIAFVNIIFKIADNLANRIVLQQNDSINLDIKVNSTDNKYKKLYFTCQVHIS